jgi:apyrase
MPRHAPAVRTLLAEYPFTFSAGSVGIMGGADEGAFQWLTLNYLLGNLGGGIQARAAAAMRRCSASAR